MKKKILKVLTSFTLSVSAIPYVFGAINSNDPEIRAINNHFGQYRQTCIQGARQRSVAPVENWRTQLMNLLSNLAEDNRYEMFIRLFLKRSTGVTIPDNVDFDLASCSRIVKIPCPANREYPVELISRFIEDANYTPNYQSNGTSILAMRYGNITIVI